MRAEECDEHLADDRHPGFLFLSLSYLKHARTHAGERSKGCRGAKEALESGTVLCTGYLKRGVNLH